MDQGEVHAVEEFAVPVQYIKFPTRRNEQPDERSISTGEASAIASNCPENSLVTIVDTEKWEYLIWTKAKSLKEIEKRYKINRQSPNVGHGCEHITDLSAEYGVAEAHPALQYILSLYNNNTVVDKQECRFPEHVAGDIITLALNQTKSMYANVLIKRQVEKDTAKVVFIGKPEVAYTAKETFQEFLGFSKKSSEEQCLKCDYQKSQGWGQTLMGWCWGRPTQEDDDQQIYRHTVAVSDVRDTGEDQNRDTDTVRDEVHIPLINSSGSGSLSQHNTGLLHEVGRRQFPSHTVLDSNRDIELHECREATEQGNFSDDNPEPENFFDARNQLSSLSSDDNATIPTDNAIKNCSNDMSLQIGGEHDQQQQGHAIIPETNHPGYDCNNDSSLRQEGEPTYSVEDSLISENICQDSDEEKTIQINAAEKLNSDEGNKPSAATPQSQKSTAFQLPKIPVQPSTGKLSMSMKKTIHLPGHESDGMQILLFQFPAGVPELEQEHFGKLCPAASFKAYLPNSDKGKHLMKLLKKAFDERMLFKLDDSNASKEAQLIPNGVHLKSETRGEKGYPDPTYLAQLEKELRGLGLDDTAPVLQTEPQLKDKNQKPDSINSS